MKTLTDPQEIEDALKGKIFESSVIAQDEESVEIHFNGGVISICGQFIEQMGVNAALEIEVRLS